METAMNYLPFLEVLIFGGDYTRREIYVSKSVRLFGKGICSVSGAFIYQNGKHGLFHLRYFKNGPLEPGCV